MIINSSPARPATHAMPCRHFILCYRACGCGMAIYFCFTPRQLTQTCPGANPLCSHLFGTRRSLQRSRRSNHAALRINTKERPWSHIAFLLRLVKLKIPTAACGDARCRETAAVGDHAARRPSTFFRHACDLPDQNNSYPLSPVSELIGLLFGGKANPVPL